MRLLKRAKPPLPRPKEISSPTNFPTGLAVATERGVYFIKGKTRFKFFSDRVVSSWSLTAVPATFGAVKHLKFGGNLGFRDGTLINNVADGKMYLVSENKRRHIKSPDVFEKYGLDRGKMIEVSEDETNIQVEGEALV